MKPNKNIHILSTDKPSRLTIRLKTNEIMYSYKEFVNQKYEDISLNQNQHIYITSNEEIKEGDWYLIEFNGLKITQCTSVEELISIEGRDDCKKIILTTDPDLIKDGIQPIDDEFLEWFVKNPTHNQVDVVYALFDSMGKHFMEFSVGNVYPENVYKWKYKITIPEEPEQPKEEPKQETLEDSIYQAIGLAANEQGIINQALATSKVMDVLKKTNL